MDERARFGELRALIGSAQPIPVEALLTLCEAAREADPARFREAWRPYLRAASPALLIAYEAELDAALALCPHARLHLSPDARRWRKKGRQRHVTPQVIEALRRRVVAGLRVEALSMPRVVLDALMLDEVTRILRASPTMHTLGVLLLGQERGEARVAASLYGWCDALGASALQTLRVGWLPGWPAPTGQRACPTLTSLSLSDPTLTAEGWGALGRWLEGCTLRRLTIHDGAADEAPLRALIAQSPALTSLSLRGRRLILGALSSLPALESLALDDVSATADTLADLLDGAEALGELSITRARGRDLLDALTPQRLDGLRSLHTLTLSNTSATDRLAHDLASAPMRLRVLCLKETALTTDGALALLRSPHLERAQIDLSHTRVSAEALRRDLRERGDRRRLIEQEGDYGAQHTLTLWPLEGEGA